MDQSCVHNVITRFDSDAISHDLQHNVRPDIHLKDSIYESDLNGGGDGWKLDTANVL